MALQVTDETRFRLLEAAGQVFAERGFRAATVREICRRADANLAAVNYHFGDKEHLYVEAVKHAHGRDPEVVMPDWSPDTPPAEKLRDYIRNMFVRLLGNHRPAWHAQLIAREITQPTKACEAMVELHIRANFQVLDGIVAELLPAHTTAVERHLIVFSIVGQCLYYKLARPIVQHLVGEDEYGGYSIEVLVDHVTRFSLSALGVGLGAKGRGEGLGARGEGRKYHC